MFSEKGFSGTLNCHCLTGEGPISGTSFVQYNTRVSMLCPFIVYIGTMAAIQTAVHGNVGHPWCYRLSHSEHQAQKLIWMSQSVCVNNKGSMRLVGVPQRSGPHRSNIV